jgi:hypothetical protein
MIAVSADYPPFVLLDIGGAGRTEAGLRGMFAALHEANMRSMRDQTRHVLIVMGESAPTARERQIIAVLSNQVPQAEKACNLVTVAVISSPFLRGALTAIGWLVPGLPPLALVGTTDEAVVAAEAHLRKHGIVHSGANAVLAKNWLRERRKVAPSEARAP